VRKEPVVIYLNRMKHVVQNPAIKRRSPKTPIRLGAIHRGGKADGPPADRNLADPDTIQSIWITVFGHRLRIDETKGFTLDGRPINLDELMIETNRNRKANGLPQVGKKPGWFV
jgi:hypothetical protein